MTYSGSIERIPVTLSTLERDYLAVGLQKARKRISASISVGHSEGLDVKALEEATEDLDRLWEVMINQDKSGRRQALQEFHRDDVRILLAAMELSARHDEDVLATEREHPLVPSVVAQLEARIKAKRAKFVGTNYQDIGHDDLLVEWAFDSPAGSWFVAGAEDDDLPSISPI